MQSKEHLYDMLQGNINRIMVTDNESELDKMLLYAIQRLFKVAELQRNHIKLSRLPEEERMQIEERLARSEEEMYKEMLKYKHKAAKIDPFWDNLGRK